MAEATAAIRSDPGTPVDAQARKERLTRTLETKLGQGYTIESESDTEAVLVMRGRRRWFGLAHSRSARYEVTLDEAGRARSRRL